MPIKTEELSCTEGRLGLITLDAPETINALSETMIDQMQATLDCWATDDNICLVMIQGKGDKGFCAGGNLRELYDALRGADDPATPARFFSKEYRLDYSLHRYPKPVICWAHRVVMGGGLGLLSACRYRLVTPDLIMSMPEISIGLFPDVGASWFLNRLPEGLGLFLGLTGARLNISDALRVGLADLAAFPHQRETLIETIQGTRWSGEVSTDDNRLYRLLNRLQAPAPDSLPESNLARHERTIARLCRDGELPTIVQSLLAEKSEDSWWQSCTETLRRGCPVSAWLIHEQLERGRQLSLEEIFRMELVMAARCAEEPDLAEGIRARLIERDQSPVWQHAGLSDVTPEYIERFFIPSWSEMEDPLIAL
ncbi:enoyl-CoA hydratase/isomerase family protein [Marinobacter salicampi]|uniref:enoyl-CoA hydratase/isomerase family protein n=1 Tax=Marinobacter salicampi TaxID=435907 RepID=UPI00140E8657|nr:enoyl-CoA hydratase/isomerase family protein [Marinobacter salicampi]